MFRLQNQRRERGEDAEHQGPRILSNRRSKVLFWMAEGHRHTATQ